VARGGGGRLRRGGGVSALGVGGGGGGGWGGGVGGGGWVGRKGPGIWKIWVAGSFLGVACLRQLCFFLHTQTLIYTLIYTCMQAYIHITYK